MPTPSNHRTQLGPATQSASRLGAGGHRNPVNTINRDLQHHTPAPRQTLGGLSTNNVYRNGLSGYGMSAGMKVGRQQGTPEWSWQQSMPGKSFGAIYADCYSPSFRVSIHRIDTLKSGSTGRAI